MLLRSDDRGEKLAGDQPGPHSRVVPKELHRLMGRSWSVDEMWRSRPSLTSRPSPSPPWTGSGSTSGSGDGPAELHPRRGQDVAEGRTPGAPGVRADQPGHRLACRRQRRVRGLQQFSSLATFRPSCTRPPTAAPTGPRSNANLRWRGATWTIGVDDVDPNLMFVGHDDRRVRLEYAGHRGGYR